MSFYAGTSFHLKIFLVRSTTDNNNDWEQNRLKNDAPFLNISAKTSFVHPDSWKFQLSWNLVLI